MNSDSSIFNLQTVRSLAVNSKGAWTEVINDGKHNCIVVFRHDDDSSHVRRLAVDYARSTLYASIRSDKCKNGTALVYRPDSDPVILGRLFDNPHNHECLGFKPCPFKTSYSLPADGAAVKKGKKKGELSKPTDSLAPATPPSASPSVVLTDAIEGGAEPSLAPSSAPSSSSSLDVKEEAPVSEASCSIRSENSDSEAIEAPPSSPPPSEAAESKEEGDPDSEAPSSSRTDNSEFHWSSNESECSCPGADPLSNAVFSEAVAADSTAPVSSGCPSLSEVEEPKARKARSKANSSKRSSPEVPPPRGANIMKSANRKKLKKVLPEFQVCGGEKSSPVVEAKPKFSGTVAINITSPVPSECPKPGKEKSKTCTARPKVKDFDPSAPAVPPARGANIMQADKRKKLKKALPEFKVGGEDSSPGPESRVQKNNEGSEKKEKSKNGDGDGHVWIRALVDKKVQKELDGIDLKHLKCYALTPDGRGIVYAEKNGECYWSCEIGSNLAEELNSSTKKRYPIAINMGSEGRYFVKYSNGDVVVNGNEKLVGIVKKKKGSVKMVAFGKEYDSYALIFEDGQTDCNKIPKSLQIILENCAESTKTEFVSMGGGGEYFVRQHKEKEIDGEGSSIETMVRYGNIHSDEMFSALEECPRDIRRLVFGDACSFVATH